MIKDYIIKERLGIGAFGIVFKVVKKTNNNIYVIKQIPLLGLSPEQKIEAKSEARILSSVRSNYIVRYYESFEENNYLNIVMEFCDGGDLCEFLNKNKITKYLLKEDLIWNIFLKITIGLATLHKAKILHRDLKTLNIFMTKNLDIKIGDFGVAKILSKSGFAKTIIGTPYYLSPELCDEKPYNDKSDVWALGCILYELSTYSHPFNAKCQASLVLKILQDKPNPIHKYYSENLQKLINLILDKNYLTRPSCYDILNLPFVIEKAKQFGLYEQIKLLYPSKNFNNKMLSNNIKRNYMNPRERIGKVYNQNTVPTKPIHKRYNKINSYQYLKSEQNHKLKYNINEEKEKSIENEKNKRKKNNYNNHVLYISKSNDNFQKIKNFRENRSKSFDRNKNQIRQGIKSNHIINISNLDNSNNNNNKRNKISNISYINISEQNNKNNGNLINNRYQNQINDINTYRNNKVINSINEFEKIIRNKSKNSIKKVVIINKTKRSINQNSNNLNIEDDLLKNIKISDIIDNKDIDTMIQKKLLQKNNNQKLINMKEFANYLNSYVDKVNKTDNSIKQTNRNNNNNQKNIIIKKKNNNNFNKLINNYQEKITFLPINYSVDIKQKKIYEKNIVNNIYDIKDNKNNNIIQIINNNAYNKLILKDNKYIEEKKIQKINSNKIILKTNKKGLLNQNGYFENRIKSAVSEIYNRNTENIKRKSFKNNNKEKKYIYKYNTSSNNKSNS